VPDNGGYVKGILRRVGVKKGNVISEQENELLKQTYAEAEARFTLMAIDWWERTTGFETSKEWDEENHKIWVTWVSGETRTEVEIWLERAE
jgi:hypothetical protein